MKLNTFTTFTIIGILFLILAPRTPSFAVTATPAPSNNEVPQEADDIEKIQRIKDLVASKVAELNLVEKRGIIGTVKEVTNMKVVISDIKGVSRQIDVDELTKFDISKTSSGISDLEKGTMYSFVGLYNKDTQRLLARTVKNTDSMPVYFEGAIASVDEENFQLNLVNEKGEKKNVDIQNSTKTSLYTSDGDLLKSGFSKLEANSRVLAIGFWDTKDSDVLAAIRVIHFEQLPPSKQMQSHIALPEAKSETEEE